MAVAVGATGRCCKEPASSSRSHTNGCRLWRLPGRLAGLGAEMEHFISANSFRSWRLPSGWRCPVVLWVTGVLWGDERPFPLALHQGPVVVGIHCVVPSAQAVQQVEHREAGTTPGLAVVRLQETSPDAATLCCARREQPVKGRLLVGVRPPAQVRDPDHLLALGDDAFQERVGGAHEVVDRLGADGPEAGNFAGLAVAGVAPQQGSEVYPHHDLVAGGLPRARGRQLDQAVERVGFWALVAPSLAGFVEGFVGKALDPGHDPGPVLWQALGVEVPSATRAGVGAQAAACVHPLAAGFEVLGGGRGPARLLSQLRKRARPGHLQEPGRGRRAGLDGAAHKFGLRPGELPRPDGARHLGLALQAPGHFYGLACRAQRRTRSPGQLFGRLAGEVVARAGAIVAGASGQARRRERSYMASQLLYAPGVIDDLAELFWGHERGVEARC